MYCPKCRQEIPKGEIVCPFCNYRIITSSPKQPSQTSQSQQSTIVQKPVVQQHNAAPVQIPKGLLPFIIIGCTLSLISGIVAYIWGSSTIEPLPLPSSTDEQLTSLVISCYIIFSFTSVGTIFIQFYTSHISNDKLTFWFALPVNITSQLSILLGMYPMVISGIKQISISYITPSSSDTFLICMPLALVIPTVILIIAGIKLKKLEDSV